MLNVLTFDNVFHLLISEELMVKRRNATFSFCHFHQGTVEVRNFISVVVYLRAREVNSKLDKEVDGFNESIYMPQVP